VTLEILDAAGKNLRTFSSDPAAATGVAAGRAGGRGRGGIPNTTALWRRAPEPFSAAAGTHRVVWNQVESARDPFGGGNQEGQNKPLLTGTFTAKLTVNGKSYTQTFEVKPDPRAPALR
jgi:hypothetical protein